MMAELTMISESILNNYVRSSDDPNASYQEIICPRQMILQERCKIFQKAGFLTLQESCRIMADAILL